MPWPVFKYQSGTNSRSIEIHSLDIFIDAPTFYFNTGLADYTAGLVVALIGLLSAANGQPESLYIVPLPPLSSLGVATYSVCVGGGGEDMIPGLSGTKRFKELEEEEKLAGMVACNERARLRVSV